MKLFIALVVLALLACQMLFCAEPAKHNDSTFQKLEGCNVEITVPDIRFWDRYCLTPGVVLAFGAPGPDVEFYLYAVDTDRMDAFYVSEYPKSFDGSGLYQWRTENHVVVLWESLTEFRSILECFVLDVKTRRFASVGEFEVSLPIPKGVEGGYDYPVNQIHISSTDTLVTFRLPGQPKLWLYGDDTYQELDSAVYQLDFRAGGLKLIYPRK